MNFIECKSNGSRTPFLDLRALAPLTRLRFATRSRIDGVYSGRHRSRHIGGAGEFVDHREYVDGEDLRRLDWKLLARSNRAYTRLYQEETNLICTLVLDASASMLFGTHGGGASKLSYAQYLATGLSHLIANQQDQVGLAVVSKGLKEFHPPASTPRQVLHLQESIAGVKTEPVTDLSRGLHDLYNKVHRRGVLLIISDFLVDDLEKAFAPVRLFRHRHWEVIMLHIVHPDEERLPEGLAYRFEGMENEGRLDCSPQQIRELYEKRFATHLRLVRSMAQAAGCDYRRISTVTPYLQTLGGFLVERSG